MMDLKESSSKKRSLKHRRRPKHRVVQRHHITYDPEVTTIIYKSEHRDITIKNRMDKQNVKTSLYYLEYLMEWIQKRAEQEKNVYATTTMNRLYQEQFDRKMKRIKDKKAQKKLKVRK